MTPEHTSGFDPYTARSRDLVAGIRARRSASGLTWFPDSPLDVARFVISDPHPDRHRQVQDLLDALRLTVDLRRHREQEWRELVALARSLAVPWDDLAEPMGCRPQDKKHAYLAALRGRIPRPRPDADLAPNTDEVAVWMGSVLRRREREEDRQQRPCGVANFPDRPEEIASFVLNNRRVHPAVLVRDVFDALRLTIAEYRVAEVRWLHLTSRCRDLDQDTVPWSMLAEPMGCTPGSRSAAEVAYRRAQGALLSPDRRRIRTAFAAGLRAREETSAWAAHHSGSVRATAAALVDHQAAYAAAGLELDWLEDIAELLEGDPPESDIVGALAPLLFLTSAELAPLRDDTRLLSCDDAARAALLDVIQMGAARDSAIRSTNC